MRCKTTWKSTIDRNYIGFSFNLVKLRTVFVKVKQIAIKLSILRSPKYIDSQMLVSYTIWVISK